MVDMSKSNKYGYPEDLIIAVRWLLHKNVIKSSEIARRLEVSPFTVSKIKSILRKRGEFPKPGEKKRRVKKKLTPEERRKKKELKEWERKTKFEEIFGVELTPEERKKLYEKLEKLLKRYRR